MEIYALPVELSRKKITEIRKKIEQKNSVFSEKRYLDSMHLPSKIIGRENETESLLGHILSLNDGFVVPFVSVYGRSGSGKSTVVKFVCESVSDVASSKFVNLRKGRTVFGCGNLIVSGLGSAPLKSYEGISGIVDCIECQIESILEKEGRKNFVLVLDEYDVIFSDARGNPSDFVYKLLQMQENLREKGLWVCIVTISNNALQEYDLDDRVKSRMGAADVFFSPYSEKETLGILQDRCSKAFAIDVSDDVLSECARLASSDHGDARRALDLLRMSGEICDGSITKDDVSKANDMLQKDRAQEIVEHGSYHARCVVGAVCALAIVNEESWSATSSIYEKYAGIVSKEHPPLKYRRISDLLVDLENSGLLVSRAYSRGRRGYGKEYKLKVSPDLVGSSVGKAFYDSLVDQNKTNILLRNLKGLYGGSRRNLLDSSAFFDNL